MQIAAVEESTLELAAAVPWWCRIRHNSGPKHLSRASPAQLDPYCHTCLTALVTRTPVLIVSLQTTPRTSILIAAASEE